MHQVMRELVFLIEAQHRIRPYARVLLSSCDPIAQVFQTGSKAQMIEVILFGINGPREEFLRHASETDDQRFLTV